MKQMLQLVRSGAIPLNQDMTGRFLPAVLAVLVLLACLMLVGASSLTRGLRGWQGGLEGRATVQILPQNAPGVDSVEARQEEVLALLVQSVVVEEATVVSEEQMAGLLEPWLGESSGGGGVSEGLIAELPVPVLIDVELADGAGVGDLEELREALSAVPGVVLDDHAGWLKDVRRLASMALAVSYLLVAFIVGAAVLIVVLLVRAGMAMHRDVVELLHLVGATDYLIAWQFQRHMVLVALRGAAVGGVGASVLLFFFDRVAGHAGLTMFAAMGPLENLFVLLVVPFVFIALAALTSGMVARRLLAEMP